jgi:hypothetical protein
MTEKIRAPWTPEQVAALNAFQQRGGMHPFTCGHDHPAHPDAVLEATPKGWRCFVLGCEYEQDWAHAFMADPNAWPKSPFGERHGPTPQEARAATRAARAKGWYDAGCARDCTEQHTYTWGRCALAPESARPEPTISIGTVVMEADGHPGIAMTSIPLSAWQGLITVAKWVSRGRSFALDADPEIAPAYPDATARFALGALADAGLLGIIDGRRDESARTTANNPATSIAAGTATEVTGGPA